MSYRNESARLARELAQLATAGSSSTLSPSELDVALIGRSETLGLLRQVLSESSGINSEDTGLNQRSLFGSVWRRSIQELEAHPVAMLVRTLATHPAPRPHVALSDVLSTEPVQDDPGTGKSWANVARHALLASHEWSSQRPQLDHEHEWSAVADVAAIAQVVTVLDRHLYAAARTHPDTDPDIVEALKTSLTSGLRSAATQTATLAAAGPLPEWAEPTSQPRPPTRVLIVNSPERAAAAQERLSAQISAATDLGPDAVVLLATGQARILTAAAKALAATDPQRAAHATNLARQLNTASTTPRRQLATLNTDDPRPVAQTREIFQYLSKAGSPPPTPDAAAAHRAALTAVVDRSPAVVRAVSQHAEQSVRNGRWLMINIEARHAKDLPWRYATRADPEPRLCVALSAAAAVATAIPVAPAPPRTPVAPPPRQTLAGVLDLDHPARPHSPAQRHADDASRTAERG